MFTDKNNTEEPVREARKFVSSLIFRLIERRISSFEIIRHFPKGFDDKSLKVVWHAIIHFDADEDLQKDSFFVQEQIKYLEMLAKILSTGDSLPVNILDEYEEFYGDIILPQNESFIGKLKSFFRFLG